MKCDALQIGHARFDDADAVALEAFGGRKHFAALEGMSSLRARARDAKNLSRSS